jgi:hypothetical protein
VSTNQKRRNPANQRGPASPLLYSQLAAARLARDEDERVRHALGLRYIGLRYGPYGKAPVELYRGTDHRTYVKLALGRYQRDNQA